MAENEWMRILGWPGYKVYRQDLNEGAKRLKLWVQRKRGNKQLLCSGCGKAVKDVAETYEREVRDLPWSEMTAPLRRMGIYASAYRRPYNRKTV